MNYMIKIVSCFLVCMIIPLTSISIAEESTLDKCMDYSLSPPFLTSSAPPLVMLVMGRNHKLYYEAYNDASDIDGDGDLETGYEPDIDYYGYFDCYTCYTYDSLNNRFEPSSNSTDKTCSGSNEWSGDFLNYLTMSRMDTLRKVLYGGYRSTDTAESTVLKRAYIPQDAHSWGKEYAGISEDGYDIRDYTPLGLPGSGKRILFASTTLDQDGDGDGSDDDPLLRVITDSTYRIWDWVSRECPVAGNLIGENDSLSDSEVDDYTVKVKVCTSSMCGENCKKYPGSDQNSTSDDIYKPVGILQKYGEPERMYFGLITGSYDNNMSGGVLRKNISSIANEISNSTGVFNSSVNGIISTINKFRIYGFDYNDNQYNSPDSSADGPMIERESPDWGNPVAEMMYEAGRYFAGKSNPTSDYSYSGSTIDSELGLAEVSWQDPYSNYEYCAKPIMLVLSDIYPSYDSDQLPGSAFSAWSESSLGSLNVNSLADTIAEQENVNGSVFIGQSSSSADDYDSGCTAKDIDGMGDIRGLCPEDPTKRGSYYSTSVSYYTHTEDISSANDTQHIENYIVGLSSPLPRIEIPLAGETITLVPFGKTVSTDQENICTYQPTNTIVDFYVDSLNATYGKFRINFEDVEHGSDHDMDTVVIYEYQVNSDSTIDITLTEEYAAAGYVQHIGYVISGTSSDGTYLEITNSYNNEDNSEVKDVDYNLDTPPDEYHPNIIDWDDGQKLPETTTRTFSPGSNPPAVLLEDPLWYAAKWGGFQDKNDNDKPDETSEWDADSDGIPDTYFYVNDPTELESTLNKAFARILKRLSAGSAASVVSGSRSGEGALYQAVFWPSKIDEEGNEVVWTGDVHAFLVGEDGNLYEDTNGNSRFDAGTDKRVILYYDEGLGRTMACVNGSVVNGSCSVASKEIEEVSYLWSSAEWLNSNLLFTSSNRATYSSSNHGRYLFTWFDKDEDGVVDDTSGIDSSGEVLEFDATDLDNANATNFCNASVINWIRGEDQAGMRSRKLSEGTSDYYWRLGDVIHSTPVVVGRPAENYDLYWGETSYTNFYQKYKNRRLMVYFGGNDGMLHAINSGFYSEEDHKFYRGYNESNGTYSDTGMDLGAEMWGYVPYNLLPHLECLTDPEYEHKYYVDLHPRVFDVRIWEDEYNNPNGTHPNGWGTIMVCGMRFGGSHVQENGRDFSSSYMIFDITDPETEPKLLGELTYDYDDKDYLQMGYSLSVPSVVPAYKSGSYQKWYLIIGSGPDADSISLTDAASTQKAKLAVIPLNQLVSSASLSLKIDNGNPSSTQDGLIELPAQDSFVGSDFVALDYDFDFNTDIYYFGLVSGESGDWGGGLYRLKVEDENDPNQWELKRMIDTEAPVTAAPNIGWTDEQVWVYFGTGRYLTAADARDDSTQYYFGIKEPKKTESSAYNFNEVSINYKNYNTNKWVKASEILVREDTGELNCTDGTQNCLSKYGDGNIDTFSELEDYAINEATNGWFRELEYNERVIGQATLLGGIVNYSTYIPDTSLCEREGSSKLYSVYYITGTPWKENVFDEAGDGDGYIDYSKDLGKGLTITPTILLPPGGPGTGGPKVIIQTSVGDIKEIPQPNLPLKNIHSGHHGWHTHDIE